MRAFHAFWAQLVLCWCFAICRSLLRASALCSSAEPHKLSCSPVVLFAIAFFFFSFFNPGSLSFTKLMLRQKAEHPCSEVVRRLVPVCWDSWQGELEAVATVISTEVEALRNGLVWNFCVYSLTKRRAEGATDSWGWSSVGCGCIRASLAGLLCCMCLWVRVDLGCWLNMSQQCA